MKRKIVIVLLLLFTISSYVNAAPQTALKRYAILVGANDGGPTRRILKYAVSDARSLDKVLKEMGGIYYNDRVLLVEPDINMLTRVINNMKQRTRAASEKYGRIEFIFYYSGHSDEEGIMLKTEKFYYKDLRQMLKDVPADMSIIVLDSCASGALTRLKGGTKKPSFMVDESVTMKGHAILTSSSADEMSQESDSIGGSFFTHYLVSGLRGAADSTHDGRVTLNEVYQYTYHETLTRTEKTFSGPQHPHYDIQMTGSGDVVLTDIRETSASLKILKNVKGRFFIRDENEKLVAEINKAEGKMAVIGLEDGRYTIAMEKEKKYYKGQFELKKNETLVLKTEDLKQIKREYAVSRGNEELINDNSADDSGEENELSISEDLKNINKKIRKKVENIKKEILKELREEREDELLEEKHGELIEDEESEDDDLIAMAGPDKTRPGKLSGPGTPFAKLGQLKPGKKRPGMIKELEEKPSNKEGSEPVYRIFPVMFSVSPRKSLPYAQSGQKIKNNFNLSLAVGGSDILNGLAVSVFGSIINEEMNGLQASSIYNYTGSYTKGMQAAGIFNRAGNDFIGIQASGIFNSVSGILYGLQSGIINFAAEKVIGLQAGTVNISGDIIGIKSGVVNLSGNTYGISAGVVNRATLLWGISAGVVNTTGDSIGLVPGVINRYGNLIGIGAGVINKGVIINGLNAGVINITGQIKGANIGVVNYSDKLNGVSIGLLNICREMNGVPIGLVNIVLDGKYGLQTYVNEMLYINFAFQNGTDYFYNIFQFSFDMNSRFSSIGFGLGTSIPVHERFQFDFELTAEKVGYKRQYLSKNFFTIHPNILARLRFIYKVNITDFFGITSGISYNYMATKGYDKVLSKQVPDRLKFGYSNNSNIHWFGFSFGIHMGFNGSKIKKNKVNITEKINN